MFVLDVYNGIYVTLTTNTEILKLLNVSPDDSFLIKAAHVQKRSRPQNLVGNLPLISFYTPGGGVDLNNDSVFSSTFVFDIYTKDDVNKAHQITNKLFEIFHKEIPSFENVGTFEALVVDAHESDVDLPNTYCFTIIMTFSVELER